jgi:tetratricopeptide (TPR) repeat protein
MTGIDGLRAAVTGLIAEAVAAEAVLLAETGPALPNPAGSPEDWAAAAVIAHNTDFRRQQVQRLRAVRCGRVPPEFSDVDHRSVALHAELAALPVDAVGRDSWRVAGELAEEMRLVSHEDLVEPDRNAWLRGRQLWLQVVVRGFWHPTGHLGEYYRRRGQPDRAIGLAARGVATADYLGAPAAARGLAAYNLACANACAGRLDEAATALSSAITLNPDVYANALRDSDLAALRARGMLSAPTDIPSSGGAQ